MTEGVLFIRSAMAYEDKAGKDVIVFIVYEKKPPSSFHSCLVGFYRHSKSPHSSSLLFSHLISSYVNISFVTLIPFVRK